MKINVLQWNVWFREDIDRVIEVIKRLDVDIICLQELTHGYIGQSQENTWEYIQNQLNFNCVHQSIPIITKDEQWRQANGIFSRFSIGEPRKHWLHVPVDSNDITDQYRGYLEADVYVGDKPLTVATTHMSFHEYLTGTDHELENLLDIAKQKSSNYLLTGDFNVTPGSRRIKELSKLFHHVGPEFSENTWTTKPHKTADFEAATLDWRYDYIFASNDVKVIDAEIIDTEVSDHLPILATIELPD